MAIYNSGYLNIIKKLKLEDQLFVGNFGLEKENVRVNEKGELALTPHPKAFGDKLINQYITTDFSESQVEMITPPLDTIEECWGFLLNIHNIVSLEIGKEYLWPQSMPPKLPDEELIPISKYNDTPEGRFSEQYREKLADQYGKKKQMISGIHYNFSFKDEMLKNIYEESGEKILFSEFKNKIYLKISRNIIKYRWLLVYLTGASNAVHESYNKKCIDRMNKTGDETYYLENATSFRNGICGYRNIKNYKVSYNSLDEYIEDVNNLVNDKELSHAKEYYSPIRLKAKENLNVLDSLKKDGIKYLEFRMLDLNPLSQIGIDKNTMYLVHLFILYCFLKDEENYDDEYQEAAFFNQELVASHGIQEDLLMNKNQYEKISFEKWSNIILDEISEIVSSLGLRQEYFSSIINDAKEKIKDPSKTISAKLLESIKQKSYIEYHMEKSKEYLKETKSREFNFIGYEDMELSTQILLKDAVKRGLDFEIIDRDENFVMLKNNIKKEYVKQATKTSLDSYATFLIMENKLVTKKVLEKENIRTPKGKHYISKVEALKDFGYYKGSRIVIKPKSTNFGIGISIFKENFNEEMYKKAIELAFSHDKSVLIEEFIKGKEYRFFVVGDKVVGILHRVPANVCGDGESTIKELVNQKNKDPLRGKGYKTPLEKISLGQVEEMFLQEQNKDFEYIPKKDEIVYLRENSNVSTGGDSIDYTDEIKKEYKEVAVKAAKAVGATICGVDMMINDLNAEFDEQNYGIIELNFNPAIHIHCYPYKGENRKLGEKILDVLGY